MFEQEKEWEGGSMLLAHVPRTEKDEIVVLSSTKFATEKGTFLAAEKAAFDK